MIRINGKPIGFIKINGRAVVSVYTNGQLVWPETIVPSIILSCYNNGYWIDLYPWTDDTPWTD